MEEPLGRGLTPKARRTRERILEAALELFADRGYEATTMRDVAREAGASLGLAYRYFASKEEFALALYMGLAEESEEWARDGLAAGTVAERFEWAMLVKLDQVSSHRGPLAALLARALDPNSRLSALGEGTAGVREKMGGVFLKVVSGASDAPREKQARELGNVLYALHLAILLYWFHDKTPEARATRELVGSARETLRYLRPALRLPPMSRVLSRLAGALNDIGMNTTGPSRGEPRRA
ncbi:MAG: Transcriptional regulator, AcrR family [uncultured Rubrobacteraceae bacterium]|uniref:Transcriptional regulator, AcrR family n=1 Tax=uncultured Rubrobacteraceae bacterium TaxID=349277 RepID=A0A6J4QYT6_9ACTN|nr:MAG: Transcriptional regulator, AcrR family [uncultured Rubrobacteraceae bacterium]